MPFRSLALTATTAVLAALLPMTVSATVTATAAVAPAEPGSSGWGDPYFPLDGNGGLDVQHYEVRDRYAFRSGRLSGSTTLVIRATQSLSRFNLDLLLPVTSVTVDGREAAYTQSREDGDVGHEVRITPDRAITITHLFTVTVRYDGFPDDYRYAGEKNWLADDAEVVAMNQPHMAPWWFASNDHPGDKATMDISVTVPREAKVIANGHRVSRTGDGRWRTTRWVADEPMSTYLAFFAAGRFHVVRGERADGLPWRAVVSRGLPDAEGRAAMRLMKRTPVLLADLEDDLGDYPFSSVGGLTTSLRVYFALENQTMPTYPYLGEGSGAEAIVVHELAHQWFGDDVAIERWRDIWLNEGAATFMEKRYKETHGGTSAATWLECRYLRESPSFWDLPIGDPGADNIFDLPVYYRGGMLLQALRNRVGESDFWALVRTWLDEQAGGNGSTAEFREVAERVSGEDLDGFFDAWLSAGKPAATADNGLTGAPCAD